MSNASPPERNGILEKYPGPISWVVGAVVLFGFLGLLYASAGGGHH